MATTSSAAATTVLVRKPRLSFWDIWNMSFGFLGIQFGFALQNANVSRIFQTLGAEVEAIPILWIAAPATGLIVQPIIGYFSDRTWNRLGRRRPYFLIGAILASLALFIMPNSPVLWVAAGMLWIMDASINISMEPFRAFVGDNLPDEQRTMGFAMQSFFIGIGAVVASFLPYILAEWFQIPNTAAPGEIPPSVKWSFYIGAAVFFLAVTWTVVRSREYSPEQLAAFEAATGKEEYTKERDADYFSLKERRELIVGSGLLLAGVVLLWIVQRTGLEKELFILAVGLGLFGFFMVLASLFHRSGSHDLGFVVMVDDLFDMPKTMTQLAFVQFFSWFALFAMWIYTTSAVTKHVYGTEDTTSVLYNEGANWVGVCFGVYNGVAALVAFLLPILAQRTSRKLTHSICLVLGALGFASIYWIKDPNLLLLSMVGVGIAWASILSMPYAILTGVLPAAKMGYFMGVFNFFIVIPQLVAASILGALVRHLFQGEAVFALIAGALSLILAAVLTLFVDDHSFVRGKQ